METHRNDQDMLQNSSRHLFLLIFPVLIIILSACDIFEKKSTITPTPELTITLAPTITPRPLISETSTLSPMPSNTPTLIPLPTLSQNEAGPKIHELMANNNGCQLPCLWGIVPGTTSLSEAVYQLNAFMNLISPDPITATNADSGAEYVYPDKGPFDGAFGSLYLRSKNNIVVAMSLDGYNTISQNYAIQDVLIEYCVPDNIWIYTLRDSYGEGVLPFVITLDYSSRGFLAYYKGNGQPRYETGLIELCYSRNLIPPKLLMWNYSDGNPFAEHKSDYIFTIWSEMKSIEDAMKMSIDEFYKLFVTSKESKPFCVDTPALLWEY